MELNGLFCGLHVLANMGTEAAKALKAYKEFSVPESAIITPHAFNKGNARTFDLKFEISQSTTISGSQRFGRVTDWEVFLDSIGETKRIVDFLRHRLHFCCWSHYIFPLQTQRSVPASPGDTPLTECHDLWSLQKYLPN